MIYAEGRAAGGGLLLIIDYPEERLEVVERLFEHVSDIVNPPLPIRFLLVSRQGFDDWRRRADVLGAPELMREVARRELQRVRRVSNARGLGEHGLERLLGLALATEAALGAPALEPALPRWRRRPAWALRRC